MITTWRGTQSRRIGYTLLGLSFLAGLIVILGFPQIQYTGDAAYWTKWSWHLRDYGITQTYVGTQINYPPLPIYLLAVLNQWTDVYHAVHLYKLFPLAFDFAGPLLLVWGLNRSLSGTLTWTWPTFSIAYLIDTLVWGQVDSVYTFFGIAAVLLALRNQGEGAVVSLALALMVKVQAVVFLPVVGLLLLPSLTSVGRVLKLLGLWVGTMAFVCLPFVLKPNGLPELWNNVIHVTMNLFFPALSMNAYNFWQLLFGTETLTIADSSRFLGLTGKDWGFGLFMGLSGLALWPLLIKTIERVRAGLRSFESPQREALAPMAFLIGGTLPVLFFYFNTQMHERYSHPAMLFFFAYGLLTGRFRLYAFVSVLFLANLLHLLSRGVMAGVTDDFATTLFNEFTRLVGLGYGVLLLLAFRELRRVARAVPRRTASVESAY
jgi:hypothetical protein